jgi:hypothetical protein
MATTAEERLDALLAAARELGRLDARLADAERAHDLTPRGRKHESYPAFRAALRDRERAELALGLARRLHLAAEAAG